MFNIWSDLAVFSAFFGFIIFLLLFFYVYAALVLMAIAGTTRTKDGWLAWIPVANIYLVTRIIRVSPWWTFAVFLPFVPMLGGVAFSVLAAIAWWKIAERVDRPGWWGIIIVLIPLVNLILMGVLAWGGKGKRRH